MLKIYWFHSPRGPCRLIFRFLATLQAVGLLGRVISSSQGLYLNTGQHKHRINTYAYQTSMPCVGFETTIPVSERKKTVHALDRSATVTGRKSVHQCQFVSDFRPIYSTVTLSYNEFSHCSPDINDMTRRGSISSAGASIRNKVQCARPRLQRLIKFEGQRNMYICLISASVIFGIVCLTPFHWALETHISSSSWGSD
jgi:hypothetical protein